MKRSEHAAYLGYSAAKNNNNFRKALNTYLDFLSDVHNVLELVERAEAIQRLAELYFCQGDPGLAEFFFKVAYDCDPGSARLMLGYARHLGRNVKDYDKAIKLCGEIIEFVSKDDFNFSGTLGAEYYIKTANELRSEFKRQQERGEAP